MRNSQIGALAAAMVLCSLSAAAVGGDKDDKLKVHLRLIDPPPVLHVGDKIKAGMVLENVSDSNVLLPDSDRNSVRFCAQWYSYLCYDSFPGKTGDLHFGPVGEGVITPNQGMEVYSPLAPKAKTPEVVDSHVLLLPGKALLVVKFTSRRGIHLLHVGPDGKWNGPRWWSGTVLAEMPLVISEEIPPAMKQRYDDVRALLADPDKPNAEKLKGLAEAAGQKHLFAARFVREIWQSKANPAIKAAALEHMASLLELGTAYEALGDLLDVLADESAPAPIRRRILAVMPDLRLKHPNPGLRIEDQGYYELPAALCDKAAQAIESVTKGRDPFLAVEARKVLEWPRWGDLRRIPPVIDRATTMPSTAPS
jgi:hypothetical protein